MKSRVLWVLLVFFGFWSSPAVANNRFIVRTPSGLASPAAALLGARL